MRLSTVGFVQHRSSLIFPTGRRHIEGVENGEMEMGRQPVLVLPWLLVLSFTPGAEPSLGLRHWPLWPH